MRLSSPSSQYVTPRLLPGEERTANARARAALAALVPDLPPPPKCYRGRGDDLPVPFREYQILALLASGPNHERGRDELLKGSCAAIEKTNFSHLCERLIRDGLGPARTAIATRGDGPTILVRRGVRPGGLAPRGADTRYTWTIAG
jgi:hypothetical protein